MNRFSALLDRLAYEPGRHAKLALLQDYFRTTPDPERGYALAAITGALHFPHVKPGLIKKLITERTDPVLFALSYDYVGDLSETIALLWPTNTTVQTEAMAGHAAPPNLTEIVHTLSAARPSDREQHLVIWLDQLDESGRWALLKLITGGLRVGVSARLAKSAVAALGVLEPDAIEEIWHGLKPPYTELFVWAEGKGPKPEIAQLLPFRPVMLAHAIEDAAFDKLDTADFCAEWKWDGIRVQAGQAKDASGQPVTRLYSRTGEDMTASFPDLINALPFEGVVDGELLVVREGRVQPFSVLQQRLNRKKVSAALLAEFPAHIRVYDCLMDGPEDLRGRPFHERRKRLESLLNQQTITASNGRLSLSALIPFAAWDELAAARTNPSSSAGSDAEAVEGCMIKRRDSLYLAGRPKGLWFKWKRDPKTVDAVLMYAQRGHGKRSSFYSDFTFGVWRSIAGGRELVPVGKAYFGFTDDELKQLDRFVRNNTIDRHGPVRVVTANATTGLVLEIAFEGLNRSSRHKSGVAMRFPRIARIRWDKPSGEADTLASLQRFLPANASQ